MHLAAVRSSAPRLQQRGLLQPALAVTSESGVGDGRISEKLLPFPIGFLVFLPYSILFTVIIGVPSFVFLRRLGLITRWTAGAVGVVAGILVSVMVHSGSQSYIEAFSKFVPTATIAALAFWAIWKQFGSERAHDAARLKLSEGL